MSSRKRKHRTDSSRPSHHVRHLGGPTTTTTTHAVHGPTPNAYERVNPDPSLFIQAYEADIIRGQSATDAAVSLEIPEPTPKPNHQRHLGSTAPPRSRSALIQWRGNTLGVTQRAFPHDDIEDGNLTVSTAINATETAGDSAGAVWVDRYDIRLLLDFLPDYDTYVDNNNLPAPDSPGGWSDLPSDAEDTFFFSPQEANDFRNDKRRRLFEQMREERLRALREEDDDIIVAEEQWGGSDEEPEEAQKELMRRTATHLLSSPNPAQLEMRILANHGGDKRFAFLRGRWSRAWKITKSKARIEKEEGDKKKEVSKPLGMLVGYEDSDAESASSDNKDVENERVRPVVGESKDTDNVAGDNSSGVAHTPSQEARRARAKEWAEKRRALKAESK